MVNYTVIQYVLSSSISLLHVLLSCAISIYCVTPTLFLLQLNIPVSGPASFLPNPPGYLQPPFHPPFLIPPYTAVDGTVPERGEGGKKRTQEQRKREEGEATMH